MGGMKNKPFADKCGVSEGVIRKIIRGEGAKDLTLEKIAAANSKHLSWFYSEDGDDLHNDDKVDVWGNKALNDKIQGKLDPAVKNELMRQTSEILDSDTIYRSAIIPNIRAFHHGMKEVARMGKLEKDMDEIKGMMAQVLEQNRILNERLGIIEDEKKRAGNDH